MTLSLSSVEDHPETVTYSFMISSNEKITLRPLLHSDVSGLHIFLKELSEETRRLSTFDGYDFDAAAELCDAINKYDKLRFVVEASSGSRSKSSIVGLIEFSFDIPASDIRRFKGTNYNLDQRSDCRFGPTLSDEYQNKGLGSKLFPYVIEIAERFGQQRIILWGGVLKDNKRAIHYYEKNGFKVIKVLDGDKSDKLDMILELGR